MYASNSVCVLQRPTVNNQMDVIASQIQWLPLCFSTRTCIYTHTGVYLRNTPVRHIIQMNLYMHVYVPLVCTNKEINCSHLIVIALSAIDHALWSGVILLGCACVSLPSEISFLLSQAEPKNHPLCCTTSYMYLAFLLNKMQFYFFLMLP